MRSDGLASRRFLHLAIGCRASAVLAAIVGTCATLVALPTGAPAQALAPLTQTLTIEDKGITIRYPEGWSAAQEANVYTLFNVPAEELDTLDATAFREATQCVVFTNQGTNHAEALRQLRQIEAEADSPSTFLSIGGWPALQRRHLMPRPQSEHALPVENSGGENVLEVTTAVALDRLLVRLECWIPEDAPPEIADQAIAIGRSMVSATHGDPTEVDREIQDLRGKPDRRGAITEVGPKVARADSDLEVADADLSVETFANAVPGASVRVTNQAGVDSELEIAVSNDGRNIVIGSNANFHFSTDGGQTWNPSAGITGNDPSLAFGPTGTFYAANIAGTVPPSNATAIHASTDGGKTFNFRTFAFVCPATGPNQCPFPDQEHIAADHFNTTPDGDQVYSVFRSLTPKGFGIVCSMDSARSWSGPQFITPPGDFPRITVGKDGFVYVVYLSGARPDVLLDKFSSCESGLVRQGLTKTVAARIPEVRCPLPGLDRCDVVNKLSSHMVAVDDTDPDHVYVAYAVNTRFAGMTSLGNEDVLVQDSIDGGETWPPERSRRVNDSAVAARRYMPWVCSTLGTAFVSWYDRRAATAANNDLTEFFGGSAFVDGQGALRAGTEFPISEVPDPNCASGWPVPPRADANGSESCSVQPQLAGRCSISGNPCDFSDGCPAREGVCDPGAGRPKYGDYNGNACIGGQFYTAWASATSPPDVTPSSSDIDIFFRAFAPDHFKAYRVATAPRTPGFEPRDVFLEDQFGATTTTVERPFTLLNPVSKDGAAAVDPTAHLKCYRISDTGPHFERRDVAVRNQFGDQTLTVFRPWTLCLPAEKNGVASDLNLHHFKCYRAVTAPRRPRAELREVLLEDQFEAKDTRVLRPFTFCNPVSKNGEGIKNPKLHLTCYFIRDTQGQPRFALRDVVAQDQFGDETLTVFRPWTLCVPSTKTVL